MGERTDGELDMMLTLADGIEKAQEERLDVSAYATAPAQVGQHDNDLQVPDCFPLVVLTTT